MFILMRGFILCLSLLLLSFPLYAEDVSQEQIKSLDGQVQDVKADVLSIGAQMRQLEEKLLYPSTTQVAVFVSLDSAAKFRPYSLEIRLDGKRVAEHVYTKEELEALQQGGVQRIYAGNITIGQHDLQAVLASKPAKGPFHSSKEGFGFSKDQGPKILEVHLADSGGHMITFRDW